MRQALCTTLLTFALSYPAIAQQQPPAAVPVGVVKVERKPVARTVEFVGRVEAISQVEIRARVTGNLEEVLFKEGDLIKEGTPLYSIEKALFQAQVEQAEGALERSKAAKILSVQQLARAEELAERQAGTLVARDQARAQERQAQGAVMTDEANLTQPRSILATPISCPITGRVGRTNITKGNVVSPTSGPLYGHRQPRSDVRDLPGQPEGIPARRRRHGKSTSAASRRTFACRRHDLPTGGPHQLRRCAGDRSTDTILARATFPNPASALVDGQFVRLKLDLATGGASGGSSGGAHCRSTGRLRVRRGEWESRRQARQARR